MLAAALANNGVPYVSSHVKKTPPPVKFMLALAAATTGVPCFLSVNNSPTCEIYGCSGDLLVESINATRF